MTPKPRNSAPRTVAGTVSCASTGSSRKATAKRVLAKAASKAMSPRLPNAAKSIASARRLYLRTMAGNSVITRSAKRYSELPSSDAVTKMVSTMAKNLSAYCSVCS